MILRTFFVLSAIFGLALSAFATHIRGGEITFERVPNNQLAIRCTLNIYRDTNSQVIDSVNDLFFGDGTSQSSGVSQPIITLIGKQTEIWTYYFRHTYSAFGVYTMYHHMMNRNSTVNNIGPSPDQVEFYIETQLKLFPALDINGPNHSPKLDKPAIDLAKLGSVYFYNPAAYDIDGDSLSFEIIPSRTFLNNLGVQPIANYSLPHVFAAGRDSAGSGPATLTINTYTGLMKWDVPNRVGEYNVAIKINEWRNGFQIGYVVRDLQIIVKDVPNKPPYLTLPADTCVEAGDALIKNITARDPDRADLLTIEANGGVFRLTPPSRPAKFTFPSNPTTGVPIPQPQTARGQFSWETVCNDVATQPYVTVFTAADNKSQEIQLTDVKAWTITVIGPKPKLLSATVVNGTIRLDWQPYICRLNVSRIKIYRREDRGPNFDSCQTGIPGGYVLIGQTDSAGTTFLDDNNGQGLKFGVVYCYRLVAEFRQTKGGESRPSNEVCARLAITVPLITKVSVEKTDSLDGIIDVVWTRPFELDTVLNPPPYTVTLTRTPAIGGVLTTIYTTNTLRDTVFTDNGLDTKRKLYTYQVGLRTNPTPNGKDSSFPAQNINLIGRGAKTSVLLSWTANVPWNNAGFYHLVYKYNDAGYVLMDSVLGQATSTYFDDGSKIPFEGPEETQFGQYYVITRGSYNAEIFAKTLVNKSFEIKTFLADSLPPCPPQEVQIQNANLTCPTCAEYLALEIKANRLTWRATVDTCRKDLAGYNIYFKPYKGDIFQKIATTQDTFFVHLNNGDMSGCYKVTTFDLAGNEVLLVDSVCNDNCVYFDLPNIFTPNGDSLNPKFSPICATNDLVLDGSLEVYNRWGVKVFSGGKEDLTNWDGRLKSNGSPLPDGTYFYRADVRFKRLNKKDERRNFKGWVEIVR